MLVWSVHHTLTLTTIPRHLKFFPVAQPTPSKHSKRLTCLSNVSEFDMGGVIQGTVLHIYHNYSPSICECVLCDGQMQVLSLLGLNGAGADARHLQSVTQQLSQATNEIQSLTNQLQSSQTEVVSCDWPLIVFVAAFSQPSFYSAKAAHEILLKAHKIKGHNTNF